MDVKDKIIVLRNLFYKCFFIGLIFLVISALAYLPCRCIIANFYTNIFGISIEDYYRLWAIFVGLIKTIIIFFFLVPALALHWTTCKCNKNNL